MRLAALAAGWTHDLVMTIGPAADGIFSSRPFSSRPFSSRRRLHRYLAARDADGAAAEIGHHLTGLCFMSPRARCVLFLAKWDIIPANLAPAVLRIPMNVALLPDRINRVSHSCNSIALCEDIPGVNYGASVQNESSVNSSVGRVNGGGVCCR